MNPHLTEIEAVWRERVREAWRSVLDKDVFDDSADFFVEGGNSLLAARLVALVSRQTDGIRVPLKMFFAAPTVDGLVDAVTQRLSEAAL